MLKIHSLSLFWCTLLTICLILVGSCSKTTKNISSMDKSSERMANQTEEINRALIPVMEKLQKNMLTMTEAFVEIVTISKNIGKSLETLATFTQELAPLIEKFDKMIEAFYNQEEIDTPNAETDGIDDILGELE